MVFIHRYLIRFELHNLLPQPVIQLRHTRLSWLQFVDHKDLRRFPNRPKPTRARKRVANTRSHDRRCVVQPVDCIQYLPYAICNGHIPLKL